MKKIIGKFKWLIHFPLWVLIISAFFVLSLGEYLWVMIKKRKIAQKIIFSNLIQTWKEKLTGRPKISAKHYENSHTSR